MQQQAAGRANFPVPVAVKYLDFKARHGDGLSLLVIAHNFHDIYAAFVGTTCIISLKMPVGWYG